MKRVLIADDNPLMRRFIRTVIEGLEGLEVCGEAVDGVDAVLKGSELHPDMVILDLSMPRMHGLEAAYRLKKLMPSVVLILFTMHKEAVRESDVAHSGISAVISKADGTSALKGKIQNLLGMQRADI